MHIRVYKYINLKYHKKYMNKLLENIVSLSYGNVSRTLYYLNIFILILYTMVYPSYFHDL